MNARKENYEYFAHFYKLRNKVTNKVRQDIVNGTVAVPEDQEFLNPMFRTNGSLNNMTASSKGLFAVGVGGLLWTMKMIK